MNKTKQSWNSILWIEAVGFSVMIVLSWVTEIVRIPHFIFGEPFVSNWHRAGLRTVVILAVWSWVHYMTVRLLKRLHYLEDFVRVCGWCRRVCHQEEWLTMEKYFSSNFETRTTHGMCPDCLQKRIKELELKKNAPPSPQSKS
ncbi:MAG TPA: hypothetical protein VH255_01435 [Verrucomicrobiae bacterium]|nr:hypothetical protein [Verrucomicrobiae bacterium]